MANFLLVIDPDTARREQTVRRAFDRVAFLPPLKAEQVSAPHYALAWAAAPHAPVSRATSANGDGGETIVFGEPHDLNGKQWNAVDFLSRQQGNWRSEKIQNGF
jgi:hypothetical protein